MIRFCFASLLLLALSSCTSTPPYVYRYVPGKTAILQNGIAYAPPSAPDAVKRAIAAGNSLQGKPYVYGGGHRFLYDVGYDCSGSTSYVLFHAGLTRGSMASDEFRHFGTDGQGEWITLYAKRGHVFMSIAGLRLDTGYNGSDGPRWSTKSRPADGCTLRHPQGL